MPTLRQVQAKHVLQGSNRPWTNGHVERMNRTIKQATVKRYFYDDHDQLRRHLDLFVDTYNHARSLKTLKGLTPTQFIWKQLQDKPVLFYEEPCHLALGLYTLVPFQLKAHWFT